MPILLRARRLWMKYLVWPLLFTLLLIGACGKGTKDVLRIGTHADYPPFEYQADSTLVGIDIDLGRRVAEKMDLEYEFKHMDFDDLLPALQAGDIDIAISALTITEERKHIVDFSVPYYVANQTILTKQDNQTILDEATDLKDYIIGAQDGTTGYNYIKENLVDKNLLSKENLRIYAVISDAVKALVTGECDFLILDNSPAHIFQKQYPLKTALTIETFESYGIALPKNAPLNERINQALQDLIDSGEVLSIIQTHLK